MRKASTNFHGPPREAPQPWATLDVRTTPTLVPTRVVTRYLEGLARNQRALELFFPEAATLTLEEAEKAVSEPLQNMDRTHADRYVTTAFMYPPGA